MPLISLEIGLMAVHVGLPNLRKFVEFGYREILAHRGINPIVKPDGSKWFPLQGWSFVQRNTAPVKSKNLDSEPHTNRRRL